MEDDDFNNILRNSTDNSVNSWICLNYNEYVKINSQEFTLYRPYAINTVAADSETKTRILKDNQRALISNAPIYAYKQKDIIRMPYRYLMPI